MCFEFASCCPGTSSQQIPDRSRPPQQEPARPSSYGIPTSMLGPVPRWLMPPGPVPPPPVLPQPHMPPPLVPPHLIPTPHFVLRAPVPRQRALPAVDLPLMQLPPCHNCHDLGMVWHEQRVEKTTMCVLCGGVGSIKLESNRDGGPCWHCHGEGETKYAGTEGDWIKCHCKQPPRRRASQRTRPRSSLERR